MKPFIVVRTDENQEVQYNAPVARDSQGQRVVTQSPLYSLKNYDDIAAFNGEYPVYSVDTQEQGELVAKYLATMKPGSTWVVCNATATFRSTPGPVAKAVYTSAGLVPAGVV